jgi:hypothetical protein
LSSLLVAATASLFGWGLDLFDLFILLFVAPIVGKQTEDQCPSAGRSKRVQEDWTAL